jgi:hypothetical protein
LYILEGYLWCYSGQKAAITGFINFLNDNYRLSISIRAVKPIVFQSAKTSKEQMKQRLINLLRLPKIPKNKEQYFFKTAIGYLHGIEVPNNVFINSKEIKMDKKHNPFITLQKHHIYLSHTLYEKVTKEAFV